MAASSGQNVTVDGRRLRLTHPDKLLYPEAGVTKAEVISYYVRVAERLIPHAAGRPVTRKRWVDGVGTAQAPGEVFFEKNLPDSAPDWIRRVVVRHKSHVTTYPLVDSPAALAWLGQVAALELHVPQWRVDADGSPRDPDRLVLDLDPGPGAGLADCVEVAHAARELLDDVGLTTWPVTSGSKGLHLYARLGADGTSYDADYVNAFAKQIAVALEDALPDLVVSTQRKTRREGKVLVDWSQNNRAKTTIAPYSLRGRAGGGPWVAAPRTWDELDEHLEHLTLDDVLERLADPDPLAALDDAPAATADAPAPDRLTVYRSKRDPERTPEPVPAGPPEGAGDGEPIFVIQEHHASRLHYDVRLEREGVLVSWAVPKGPPTRGDTNHLAVPTEDHPLEYATFEGTIPRGEYGAGEMTIWDHGTYTLQKWKDGEVIADLHGSDGGGLGGSVRFALIRTGENWLMHRMSASSEGAGEDAADAPAAPTPSDGSHLDTVAPMLATAATERDVSAGHDWAWEMKWDGVRVVAAVDGTAVRLTGRSGRDATSTYPEVAEALAGLGLDETILDGEIVALDEEGAPSFGRIQHRIGLTRPRDVAAARRAHPVRFVVFDVLAVDGTDTTGLAYTRRRGLLDALAVDDAEIIDAPPAHRGSLAEAMAESAERRLEGVVAKRVDSRYRPGSRTAHWLKLKHSAAVEVVLVGWRPGKGGRSGGLGSVLVAVPGPDGELVYAGRVGTGFDERTLRDLRTRLGEIERTDAPVEVPSDVRREAHWVEPRLVGEVAFGGWTDSGHLRHPVWRGLREDKTPGSLDAPGPA